MYSSVQKYPITLQKVDIPKLSTYTGFLAFEGCIFVKNRSVGHQSLKQPKLCKEKKTDGNPNTAKYARQHKDIAPGKSKNMTNGISNI